jgi:hypothetical protein
MVFKRKAFKPMIKAGYEAILFLTKTKKRIKLSVYTGWIYSLFHSVKSPILPSI